MKRYLLLLALLPASAFAQVSNPSIIPVATAPSGSCAAGLPNQQVTTTGAQYSCQNVTGGVGTWAAIGGSGGSGTVTSVSVTTANGVSGTVATATTTPAISLTLGAINPTSTGAGTPGTGAFATLALNGQPLGVTYFMRGDGTAGSKAAATSCSSASTAMNVTTHNSQTFNPGDKIVVCDSGGQFTDAILTPPSSGSSASQITYTNSGFPVVNGSDEPTSWTPQTITSPQYLQNPGLETWTTPGTAGSSNGSLPNWAIQTGGGTTITEDTTTFHGGAASARVQVSGSNGFFNFDQTAAATASTSYTVSFWYKWAVSGAGHTFGYQVTDSGGDYLTSGGTWTGSSTTITISDATTAWTQLSQTFTSRAGITSLTLNVTGFNATSNQINIDDLALVGPNFTIYSTPVSVTPNQVLENSVRLTPGTSTTLNLGSFYYSSPSLYVRTYEDTTPVGKTMEVADRTNAMSIAGKTNISVNGIEFRGANGAGLEATGNFTGLATTNIIADYNYAEGEYWFAPSNNVSNVTSNGSQWFFNGASGLEHVIYTQNGPVSILNGTASFNAQNSTLETGVFQFMAGIKTFCNGNNTGSLTLSNIKSFGNASTAVTGVTSGELQGPGIWIDTCSLATVQNSFTYNNWGAGYMMEKGGAGDFLINNSSNNDNLWGVADAADAFSTGGIYVRAGESTNSTALTIANNTVTGSWIGLKVHSADSSTITNLTVRNNSFHGALSHNIYVDPAGATGSGNTYTYLDLGPDNTSTMAFFNATSYSTYAALQTAQGYTTFDTQQISAANANTFALQQTFSLMQGGAAAVVASATTIAPTTPIVHISGTTPIATITLPSGFVGGCFNLIPTSGTLATTTAGNIQAVYSLSQNTLYDSCYSTALAKWVISPSFNPAVSGAISSATGGSGISAVTCTTAACTSLRGTYTMTATTVSAGATILTLVWPTTTTAYACIVSQDGGTLAFAPSHAVATATGMTIASDLAITSGSIGVDYSCQP